MSMLKVEDGFGDRSWIWGLESEYRVGVGVSGWS